MFRNVLILLCLSLLWVNVSLAAAEPVHFNQVKFRVQLSDLAAEVTHNGKTEKVLSNILLNGLAKGKDMSDYLEVSYPGVLYSPLVILEPVDSSSTKFTTPLDAAQAEFSAWRAGDDQLIIAAFCPEDQPYIKKRLADPKMREANIKLARALEVRKISGEIRYKGFAVLFVKDFPGLPGSAKFGPIPYTFVETPRGWKRTNALAGDELYGIIFPMLRQHKGKISEMKP
jgi:hypothetical protein